MKIDGFHSPLEGYVTLFIQSKLISNRLFSVLEQGHLVWKPITVGDARWEWMRSWKCVCVTLDNKTGVVETTWLIVEFSKNEWTYIGINIDGFVDQIWQHLRSNTATMRWECIVGSSVDFVFMNKLEYLSALWILAFFGKCLCFEQLS